ncbi:MAG: efflux RND transporter permease subunit [Thermoanaerobaculia bacterium]|nr:efflux RND transporter permease subunit [Thermoanaerobaculia bacterium]
MGSEGRRRRGRLRARRDRRGDEERGEATPAERESRPSSRGPGTGGTGGGRSFATHRPVAVAVVFLAAVVFGWLSYFRLPVTLMPEMSYPTLTVRTEYPGAAPEEVENEVSRPIEEALGVVGGLQRILSISRADVSDVVLEFSWDTEMSDAVQDTLEKLDQVFLPEGTERPLVLRFDPSLDPVMELSLSGEGERFSGEAGLRRLRRIAELRVKRQLEPIKGVAAVQVRGGLEEEIRVALDERELRRTGISVERVIERLAEENVNLAGGTLEEGTTEYMVRTLNEYQDLDQISDTVITRVRGREVRLRDLGTVRMAHRERQIATRVGGAPAVLLEVYKEADANMVALADRVTAAIGEWDRGRTEEREANRNGDSSELGPGEEKQEKKQEKEQEAKAEEEEETRQAEKGPGAGRQRNLPLAAQLFRDEEARLAVAADRSEFIESSISEVRNTAILGGILAVVVLYLFLGSARTTAIIAVSIPASLLITFAPLNLFGVSLNIMSLGGLALGVGMLVDSSIVVLESIFRCREEGDGLMDSVVRGTAEVRGAVVASTLTSIAVFFPMVFVEGVAGQAFGDLGLAVIVSLLASLAVAVYLIPMLAARRGVDLSEVRDEGFRVFRLRSWKRLRTDLAGAWEGERALWKLPLGFVLSLYLMVRFLVVLLLEIVGAVVVAVLLLLGLLGRLAMRFVVRPVSRVVRRGPLEWTGRGLERIHRAYSPLLARSLARPVTVLALVVVCLGVTFWLFATLDTELLPEVHQGELTVEVALPPGTPLEETEQTLAPIEEAILAEGSPESEPIESLLVTYGFDPTQTARSDEGEHTARFKVVLERADPVLEEEVVEGIRHRLAALPDVDQRVIRPVLFSFKTPVEVEVHGERLDDLRRYGERVEEVMASMPELIDVQSTLTRGAPEVEIVYDRELLARYGLNIAEVADRVRSLVRGTEATKLNRKDRRIPIVVQLAEDDRRTVEQVRSLVVNPGGETPIPLSAVADVEIGEGPSEVRRIDARRVALVRANLAEVSLGRAVERIEDELSTAIEWPPEMTFVVAGQQEEWRRSAGSLWLALSLSVFLVYVIMAAQFESLLYPFVILFTIPLAFFGTGLVLWLLGINLSIVVFLGMIMLAGIVVNNAIVLVDYANLLKRRGHGRLEAVQLAGEIRLRPILMTTATTVLGLVPMAVGVGDGAELRTPMAIAVIGGLLVSTLLTLVAIPVLYSLLDGIKERVLGEAREEERDASGSSEGDFGTDLGTLEPTP